MGNLVQNNLLGTIKLKYVKGHQPLVIMVSNEKQLLAVKSMYRCIKHYCYRAFPYINTYSTIKHYTQKAALTLLAKLTYDYEVAMRVPVFMD